MKDYVFFRDSTPPIWVCLKEDIRYTRKEGVKKWTYASGAASKAIARISELSVKRPNFVPVGGVRE